MGLRAVGVTTGVKSCFSHLLSLRTHQTKNKLKLWYKQLRGTCRTFGFACSPQKLLGKQQLYPAAERGA